MRSQFLILCIFLVACIPQQAPGEEQSAIDVETTKTVVNNTLVDLSVPVKCEDPDGQDINTMGKTVLTYSDGAKETLDDKCDKETGFEIEYYCEGLNAKTKINRCTNSCVKGACT